MNQKRQVKRRGKRMLSGALSFILALSMIFMAVPALRAEAATIQYVDRYSIENVSSGGTIILTKDEEITGNQSGETVMVFLKRSCTLDGQGHSLIGNGNSKGNFLYDKNGSAKTFNLTNITLVNNNCRILNPRLSGTVFNADSSVVFKTKTNGSPSVWGGGLAEINPGATLNLNGSAVNGVRSSGNGGAFNINGTVNLNYTGTGNEIKNCEAVGGSGGVARINSSGKLNIIDATITNNSAKSNGGAIYLASGGTLILKGNTVITGNTVNGNENNICLENGAIITLAGFTGKAGVTLAAPPELGSSVKIATGATEADATRITSDDEVYIITYNSAEHSLTMAVDPVKYVIKKINALPEAASVATEDKDAIAAARAAYETLTPEQRAEIPESLLQKLIAAENALVEKMIDDLPDPTSVTTGDEDAIVAARAAYEALSSAQKGKISSAKLKKLAEDEAALKKVKDADGYVAYVQGLINGLPTAAEVTAAHRDKIMEAKAAYEALTNDQKNSISNTDRLTKAEEALAQCNTDAAADVNTKIAGIVTPISGTGDEKEKIKTARDAYEALTSDQQEIVTEETLKKLTDAEKALEVAEMINALPAAAGVTTANKTSIEAARSAYNALTDSQKAYVSAETVLKHLTDAEDALAAAKVVEMINALPAAADVTTVDETSIEAARAAYDALTDPQKAYVPGAVLKHLTDAEDALAAAKVAGQIKALPLANAVTTGDKTAIDSAKNAYEVLNDAQKAYISDDIKQRLEDAVNALAAAEVTAAINTLPAAADVTTEKKKAIEDARSDYEALDSDQKKYITENTLQKLMAAENALADKQVEAVKASINALPQSTGITNDNKSTEQPKVAAAREAYNALTDAQKAKVDNDTLKKLTDDEAAIAKLEKQNEYIAHVKGLIDALPAAGNVTEADRDAIFAARAAYDALTTDEERNAIDNYEKLTAAENALNQRNDAAAAAVNGMIDAIDTSIAGTDEVKAKIKDARDAYEALTADQKKGVTAANVTKLTNAEAAWTDAYKNAQKTTAGTLSGETPSTEVTSLISAAKNAIDGVTYNPSLGLEAFTKAVDEIITKLTADVDDQKDADAVIEKIGALPVANAVAVENKEAIEEARAAYDALTEVQKAYISNDIKKRLEDAVNALAAAKVTATINALPAATNVTTGDEDAIEAARSAYDSLDSDQKKYITENTLQKLKAAENALADKQVEAVKIKIDALPAAADVIIGNKGAIEAARAAYDALTDAQKAKVDNDTLKKLTDDEAAIAKLEKQSEYIAHVKGLIDALPAAGNVTEADRDAIFAARAAYDALTTDDRNAINNYAKLIAAENVLNQRNTDAAADVNTKIAAIGTSISGTGDEKAKIKAARDAYEALTADQQAKVTKLIGLTDAEAAWTDAYKTAQKTTAGTLSGEIPSTEVTSLISAAKNAIGGVTYNPSLGLEAFTKAVDEIITKLTADVNDQKAAEAVIAKIDDLPLSSAVSATDKGAIEEARTAYDALTEVQKAKVPAEKVKKLTDVEAALKAAEVKAMIEALPVKAEVTLSHEDEIEAARAAYDGLDSDQKKYITENTLQKLMAAENALADKQVEAVKTKIDALPAATDVKLGNKEAIEAARVAYNALTDAQKAKVDNDTLKKLTDDEAAIAKLEKQNEEYIAHVKNLIDALPAAVNVTVADRDAIVAAKAAYDALTTDGEKNAIDNYSKLIAAENALNQRNTAAADAVNGMIDAIDTPIAETDEEKAKIKAARDAYEALTADQKKGVTEANVTKLTNAEAAWTDAYKNAQKTTAGTLSGETPSTEVTSLISAAKNAIDGVTYNPSLGLEAFTKAVDEIITKLTADVNDQNAADAVIAKIDGLPASSAVSAADKVAIEEAIAAYDALTEVQKAKVPAEEVAKLTDVEAALKVAEVKAMIEALPIKAEVALSDKNAIEAARAAYDALTDAQKTQVGSSVSVQKLTDAEEMLAVLKVMSEIASQDGKQINRTGSPIQLVNAPASQLPSGYSLKYAVTTGNSAPSASDYSASLPTGAEAGTYYLWYKVTDGGGNTVGGPAHINVTIKTQSGGGSGTGGGGGSTDGGSGGSSGGTESYTIPVINENTVNVKTEITDGTAVVGDITTEDIEKVTAKDGDSPDTTQNTTIEIDVSGAQQKVDSVQLTKDTVDRLAETAADNGNGVDTVTIRLTNARVELDAATLQAVSEEAEGNDIRLVVDDMYKKSSLNTVQRKAIQSYEDVSTFEAYFESNGRRIHDFKGGTARVSVKYDLPSGKLARFVHMLYLNPTGAVERFVTTCADGWVTGFLNHFSEYAIVYDTAESNATGEAEDKEKETDPEPDPEPDPVETVIMYRIYNPNSGEHFYTADEEERDNIVEAGWNYEGIGWIAPIISDTPVYRLYNANVGDHLYTTSIRERDSLIKAGWRDEGIGWYSDDEKTVPLYRQYNPNAITGTHNYTAYKEENDWLVGLGWRAEDIGWYGVAKKTVEQV